MNISSRHLTQILFTILLSSDHYLRCILKVYIISHTKEKPSSQVDIFRWIRKAIKIQKSEKYLSYVYYYIHLLQLKTLSHL